MRKRPTDRQIARFIEEREPNLDDLVVTAVAYAGRSDVRSDIREALASDAARALGALDLDSVVARRSIRQAAVRAAAATAALTLASGLFSPWASRATNVATAYLFPARLSVEVTPGTARVKAGDPLTITARIGGLTGEVTPTLSVTIDGDSRAIRMTPGAVAGTFAVTIDKVTASFDYHVKAAGARSDDFAVTALRAPRVERIDLSYEFPRGLGLEPRTDEDSGDIYGPPGTRVRLRVTADKPTASAALVLSDGTRVSLTGAAEVLDGDLTIDEDASYRVALVDADGLENAGDTEYFIRTLDDRPPDVRILRPASDKHVTPLEEVLIEARADDDFGIASLDLVFQSAGGKERAVPLRGTKGGLTAAGLHTLFMEDLKVQPGDFVTYYARARDVNRGRRSTEARSDIFFLEVKPFEEEFVAAQSQAMGQGGMQGDSGLQGLIDGQKEIIVATWKLDARARRARDAKSEQDIKAISRAQSELRTRAEEANGQVARAAGDPRRRRSGPRLVGGDDPIGKAVEAMGRAVGELDQLSTTAAIPHEMEALNQLLRADAEIKRRQVTRSQQAGGGGGANRAEADLTSLFDQELRRRQSTNYETPNSTEERQDVKQDDPLERIRELARRQDALNRQQRDLARNRDRLSEEEMKRQLERLTRDQNELRQMAEQLARSLQGTPQRSENSNGQSSGQSAGQGQQDSRRLRQISEDMRNAATGTRRQDAEQAAASGARAAEGLRELERQMQTTRPDDRRRALGDLQLETRQLADSQRRLANEAGRTAQGQPGDDARRRLAGEQERLADRAERLEDQIKRLSRGGAGQPDERRATEEAARELDRQKVEERMRQSAEGLRQPSTTPQGEQASDGTRQAARQGEDLARSLDRVADQLGAATGTRDADSRRLSDQLAKSQELRETIATLERQIAELQREGQQSEAQANGQARDGQAAPLGPQQAQGQQSGQQSQGRQSSAQGREGNGGQDGGATGGNGGRVQQLQRELGEHMRSAERLAGEIRNTNPGLAPNPDASWWRSFSAPGTEAFKQDFARWETLKKNLLVALENVESKVSAELRTHENKERLNAGGHDAVAEAYRELVDKYYRSLAAPRKPQ